MILPILRIVCLAVMLSGCTAEVVSQTATSQPIATPSPTRVVIQTTAPTQPATSTATVTPSATAAPTNVTASAIPQPTATSTTSPIPTPTAEPTETALPPQPTSTTRPPPTQLPSHAANASCPAGPIFTVSPIEQGRLLSITPLGNLNPPDHTLPTDHIYLVLKEHINVDASAIAKVAAPSDLRISQIRHQTAKIQGTVWTDDYAIDFSPCRDIYTNFGHVTKLSPALESAIAGKNGNCQTQRPRPGDEYTYCRYEISITLKAGDAIGEAGGGTPTGLDWQVLDYRAKPLAYANPKRYRESSLYFACPLDLYTPAIKATLYSKLGYSNQKRTVEPLCGLVNQDILGTAQGNWFTGGPNVAADSPETWSQGLALVHDNIDASVGVVSIGGVIGNPGRIMFTPASNGTVNREFSEVRADGIIYCYEGRSGPPGSQTRKVLIQMTNDTNMNVESQSGTCTGTLSFTSSTLYQR